MGVNVQNKAAQHATISLVEDGGKTKLSVDGGPAKGAVGIGATNSVGPKTVETSKGGFITELRDAVGGTLSAKDVGELFERLTFSDGRGDVEGINGVKLIGLTDDAFTVAIDNGRAVDRSHSKLVPIFWRISIPARTSAMAKAGSASLRTARAVLAAAPSATWSVASSPATKASSKTS
ncbi:MAG: hypothetical protein ACFB6S_14300 [Geminicoccaceae bacterium]